MKESTGNEIGDLAERRRWFGAQPTRSDHQKWWKWCEPDDPAGKGGGWGTDELEEHKCLLIAIGLK